MNRALVGEATLHPRDDLHLEIAEKGRLQLADEDLRISAERDVQSGTVTYTAMSEHAPLHGQNLVDMLNTVAPVSGFASAVVADWVLPDHVGSPGSYSSNLVRAHQTMGQAWNEFMASRPAFLQLFSEAANPQLNVNSRSNPVYTAEELSLRKAAATVVAAGTFEEALGMLTEIIEVAEIPDAADLARDTMVDAVNRRRKHSRLTNDEKLAAHFGRVNPRHLTDEVREQILKLPADARDRLSSAAEAVLYDRIKTEDQDEFYIPKTLGDRTGRSETTEPVRALLQRRFDDVVAVELPPEYSEFACSTIEPVLQWQTTPDGERSFVLGQTAEALPDHVNYQDNVAGVLLAAYLQPDVTATWQPRRSFGKTGEVRNGAIGQGMGPAQVPVLALLPKQRQQLLGSPLIEAAEATINR